MERKGRSRGRSTSLSEREVRECKPLDCFLFKASLSSSELDDVEEEEDEDVLGDLRWCFLFFFFLDF